MCIRDRSAEAERGGGPVLLEPAQLVQKPQVVQLVQRSKLGQRGQPDLLRAGKGCLVTKPKIETPSTAHGRTGIKKGSETRSRPTLAVVTKAAKERSTAIEVVAHSQDGIHAATARTLTRPEVGAACAIEKWQKNTHDVNELAAELTAQVQAVNGGDLRRAEGMLISQAHTLDNVFSVLLCRATAQTMLPQWEAYMRMAMRAQSQCRMNLEALAEMKNPKAIAFVKQANIAHGHQQVNNGTHAHAEEKRTPPTQLLEQQHGGWMDPGTTSEAVGASQAVEAVGAIDRAAKRRGKG